MPYQHPVAVVISVLWWSLFLGCLGGSVGVLLSLLGARAPARPEESVGEVDWRGTFSGSVDISVNSADTLSSKAMWGTWR
jgi:hypothetical protein